MPCQSFLYPVGRALFLSMIIPGLVSCATTVSGRINGPEIGPDTLRDARVNVTRLDHPNDSTQVDEPATVILTPDEDGAFSSTDDLPKGKYLVEALVPGYEPASQQVDLSRSQKVNLVLKPLGQARAKASEVNSDPAASRGEGGAVLTLPQF